MSSGNVNSLDATSITAEISHSNNSVRNFSSTKIPQSGYSSVQDNDCDCICCRLTQPKTWLSAELTVMNYKAVSQYFNELLDLYTNFGSTAIDDYINSTRKGCVFEIDSVTPAFLSAPVGTTEQITVHNRQRRTVRSILDQEHNHRIIDIRYDLISESTDSSTEQVKNIPNLLSCWIDDESLFSSNSSTDYSDVANYEYFIEYLPNYQIGPAFPTESSCLESSLDTTLCDSETESVQTATDNFHSEITDCESCIFANKQHDAAESDFACNSSIVVNDTVNNSIDLLIAQSVPMISANKSCRPLNNTSSGTTSCDAGRRLDLVAVEVNSDIHYLDENKTVHCPDCCVIKNCKQYWCQGTKFLKPRPPNLCNDANNNFCCVCEQVNLHRLL